MDRDQEIFPNELVQFEVVHVAACADLRCVHDDEYMVWVHMDSRNMVAVPAFADRHRMELELVSEQCLGVIVPLRNVQPEESVAAVPQVRQLSQVAVAHALGFNPAQLHGGSPFHVVSTPRHGRSPYDRSPRPGGAWSAEERSAEERS